MQTPAGEGTAIFWLSKTQWSPEGRDGGLSSPRSVWCGIDHANGKHDAQIWVRHGITSILRPGPVSSLTFDPVSGVEFHLWELKSTPVCWACQEGSPTYCISSD